MAREIVKTKIFDKHWAEMGLTDDDLHTLENHIIKNPSVGDIIQGTGGLIKLRWNLPNIGKRGGIRTLYLDFIRQEKVILVNCYAKGVKDSLTDKEKAVYKDLVKQIGRELNK